MGDGPGHVVRQDAPYWLNSIMKNKKPKNQNPKNQMLETIAVLLEPVRDLF
ncbi:hypothetical protein [Undibacterium sp. KW1]|uniref:hypothetical protein n=1 Tax=Undibacterium sp. KW1 TaxID=2058624 RepID=UPI001E31A5CE|nr:hypothetical protein [Undibacterium sp. KW1]